MKKTKYKIAVFTDLKKSLDNTLKSAISMAKIIHADIELFHITKASAIVNLESQLSAMRNINNAYVSIDKEMTKIVNSFSKESGVQITHTYAIGSTKNEIDTYIKNKNPDIIVLRKESTKLFGLLFNNITNYVLQNFPGTVFITDDNEVLDVNTKLSMALLNAGDETPNFNFAETLFSHSEDVLKSFKIVTDANYKTSPKTYYGKKAIEYVFDSKDNDLKALANYISLSNVNLLCIDRWGSSTDKNIKRNLSIANIKDFIHHLKVPLLITAKPN